MNNSKTLLTGASGFLGQYLLNLLGPDTISLGRNAQNTIVCDLSVENPKLQRVDRVIHVAGKAHQIPKSFEEKKAYHQVNYLGTINLLTALETFPPKRFTFISTVAVYGEEQGEDISEDCNLRGRTPYARSKIMAEKVVEKWCAVRNIPCLILRLPLVVGENPPGNLGAIWRMICMGTYLRIEGNSAKKSMVLAEDVAKLIANWEGTSGIFNLTDGVHPRFSDLEEAIAQACGKKLRWSIPFTLLRAVAKRGDQLRQLSVPFPLTTERLQKMTQTLTFSDQKAVEQLNWNPRPVLDFFKSLYSDR